MDKHLLKSLEIFLAKRNCLPYLNYFLCEVIHDNIVYLKYFDLPELQSFRLKIKDHIWSIWTLSLCFLQI